MMMSQKEDNDDIVVFTRTKINIKKKWRTALRMLLVISFRAPARTH